MTSSTIKSIGVEREMITTRFLPGTKQFLESYRRQHGLRSSAEALRRIVFLAAGEFELANN